VPLRAVASPTFYRHFDPARDGRTLWQNQGQRVQVSKTTSLSLPPWIPIGLGRKNKRTASSTVRLFIYLSGTQLLFELHVNAAASGVDSNAVLCGGNADYHTGLI
jgi:hypothetical protein